MLHVPVVCNNISEINQLPSRGTKCIKKNSLIMNKLVMWLSIESDELRLLSLEAQAANFLTGGNLF